VGVVWLVWVHTGWYGNMENWIKWWYCTMW